MSATPKVVGLDLSLTSTGVACAWPRGAYDTSRIKPGEKLRGHQRLALLLDRIGLVATDVDLVVVEGPAFGAKGSAYHQLAGLWWMATHELWKRDVPLAVASPAAVKQYATGRGTAGKDDVLMAVARRFPDFNGGNDEADALVLAAMGADWFGMPLVTIPAAHRKALDKVEWPTNAAPSGGGPGDGAPSVAAPAGAAPTAKDLPDLLDQLGHTADDLGGRVATFGPADGVS